MSAESLDPSPPSRLTLLTGVARDERAALAWSFFYFFTLLCAYGLLRPLRGPPGRRVGAMFRPDISR